MSDRTLLVPDRALEQRIRSLVTRVTRLERRVRWPGAVRYGVSALLDSNGDPVDAQTPEVDVQTYPPSDSNWTTIRTLTLDPGRWLITAAFDSDQQFLLSSGDDIQWGLRLAITDGAELTETLQRYQATRSEYDRAFLQAATMTDLVEQSTVEMQVQLGMDNALVSTIAFFESYPMIGFPV